MRNSHWHRHSLLNLIVQLMFYLIKPGASDGVRTHDIYLGKVALYLWATLANSFTFGGFTGGVKIVFFGKKVFENETICNEDTSVPEKNVFFCNDCYGIGLILQAFAIFKNCSSQRLRNSVENKKRTNKTKYKQKIKYCHILKIWYDYIRLR